MELTNKQRRSERMRCAREKNTHTKSEWLEMKAFFNICVKCEGASMLANIERDHIIPIYIGGSDGIENIQPLCARCNVSKTQDTTDYRVLYCDKHKLQMPLKWVDKRRLNHG